MPERDPRFCPECGQQFQFELTDEALASGEALGEPPIWDVARCPNGHRFEVKDFFRWEGETGWRIGEPLRDA